MTEQDLADRLEKARRLADMLQEVALDKRFSDEAVGIMCRSHVDEILASLRRSAPASGEMREVVSLASDKPGGIVAELMDDLWSDCGGSHASAEFWHDANTIVDLVIKHLRARTPSGETREEVDLIKKLARYDIPGDDGHSYSEETTERESNDLHLMVSKARLLLYNARTPTEREEEGS